jgi:hypothetical protein
MHFARNRSKGAQVRSVSATSQAPWPDPKTGAPLAVFNDYDVTMMAAMVTVMNNDHPLLGFQRL